jgi:serine/threonine protein kinase
MLVSYSMLRGDTHRLIKLGTDIESSEEVALKLVPIDEGPWVLDRETSMYEELREGVGIPRVHWYGKQDGYSVMVQELLGPTLVDLLKYCGGRFTLKTVLLIADQAISRIRHIHSKGIMHGDIKPDNLLMGTGKQGNVIYVVDFGLAENFEHPGKNRPFGLAVTFASLNQHRKRGECSRGHDPMGYVLRTDKASREIMER